MQKKNQIKNCPECEEKLERAKPTRYGLGKSCPNNCGLVLVHEQKWYSSEKEN